MPPRSIDTRAYIGMLRRMIRAAARRVAVDDVEYLGELLELEDELREAVLTAVRGLRAAGYTWRALGSATGTSHVAAIQKWGQIVK